ncbi:MAG: hypothetical protein IPL73_00850 [Candidatus Obscuribacter sp.]|nr:hypothetical protein [Candidatus Obscuribacter sp.]
MDSKNSPKLPVVIPLFRNLFVITDPGRDQDDEDVLVMLNRLIRLQILQVMGVVANMAPAVQRARQPRAHSTSSVIPISRWVLAPPACKRKMTGSTISLQ